MKRLFLAVKEESPDNGAEFEIQLWRPHAFVDLQRILDFLGNEKDREVIAKMIQNKEAHNVPPGFAAKE